MKNFPPVLALSCGGLAVVLAPVALGQTAPVLVPVEQNAGFPVGALPTNPFAQPFPLAQSMGTPFSQAMGIPGPVIPVYGTALGTQSASRVPQYTAFIDSRLTADDNYNLRSPSLGNALIWTTTLGLGYVASTLVDSLATDISGAVRLSDLPVKGGDATFDDPTFNLAYTRATNDDSIGLKFNYNRADLDYFNPLLGINPDGSFDSTSSSGTREAIRGSFSLLLNQNGPISFDLLADMWQNNYYDASPSLQDQTRANVNAVLGFRLNPLFVATLGAGYRYKQNNTDPSTDITTSRVDAGFNADLNQLTTMQFRLGYASVEDTRKAPGDQINSNVVGDLSVQSILQNGNIRGAIVSRIDENGSRLDITAGRLYQGQYSTFDGALGGSISDQTSWRLIGNVDYTYKLRSSTFSAHFAQITTTDTNSQNVINTHFSLGYSQQVTSVSTVGIVFLAGLIRYENSSQDPTERTSLTLNYNRKITQDWSMNFGYRQRFLDSNTVDNANSNALFVGLNRNFSALN